MGPGRAPSPTRQNLLALERRLARVSRGTALLRRKREAIVAELFRRARPAAETRQRISECARSAYPVLLDALAESGWHGLAQIGWPSRDMRVEMRSGTVWGTAISEILRYPPVQRTLATRATPPAGTGAAAIEAADAFERMLDLLLTAANRETLLRRLGDALARTSRQVNTLERRLDPTLRRQRANIQRTLDEREREEHLRLSRLLTRTRRGG